MKQFYFLFLTFLISSLSWGQISITGTTYSENFDGMTSTGTTTPAGWFVGSGTAAASNTVIVGTGSGTGGGNYNFGAAGINPISDRALGSLASGTGGSRNTEVRFTNNTGMFITNMNISYTGEQWRLGQTSSLETGFKLYYSTDGTNFSELTSGFHFLPPITTGTVGPLDGNLASNRITNIGGNYTPAVPISNTSVFYLRWVDLNDSGTDAGIAIDDFSLNLTLSASTPPSLVITSPSNGAVYNPETTAVNINLAVANFNVANGTGDGHIHWNLNGGATQMKYDTNPISLTSLTPGNYTVNLELVDNSHQSLSPAKTASVSFTIVSYTQVSNVAALRAGTVGGNFYYELTGEAVVTYARASRNQKYIQDATAGILIDDNNGVITPSFVIGDGMTGLKGYLGAFNGVLQFVPLADLQGISSNGNVITPEVVTISQLLTGGHENYESELVKIKNATFADGNGTNTFATSTNYDITDASGTMAFRTGFSEANYIGSTIPTPAQDLVVLVAEFNSAPQVYARSLSDLTLDVVKNEITNFSLYPNPVKGGKVFINSANNYAERTVQVFDVLGKQVVNQKGTQSSIDVSHLNKGIYIIKVAEEGKVATRKLVIE